jgi:hypothetical protein
VEKVVSNLTPRQVLKLGQELGLYYSTLKKIPEESLPEEMVHSWLIKMDDVSQVGGNPTWRSFAQGLAEQEQWGIVDIIRERNTGLLCSPHNHNLEYHDKSVIDTGIASCFAHTNHSRPLISTCEW